MFADHISRLMEYCPNFVGVYACDKLPLITPNISLIINTDLSIEPGEHWVAVYIGRNTVHFFDSFGRDLDNFSDPFKKLMIKFSENFKMTSESRLLQNPFNQSCGLWCIYYLLCKTCRVEKYYKYFSENLVNNEVVLKYFFEYLY